MRGFFVVVAAVLAAIGIGIAVESATGPGAMGPRGVRFTVAWPATPRRQEPQLGSRVVHLYEAAPARGEAFSVASIRDAGLAHVSSGRAERDDDQLCHRLGPPAGCVGYWTAYAPLPHPVVSHDTIHVDGRTYRAWFETVGPALIGEAVVPIGDRSFFVGAMGRPAAVRWFVDSFQAIEMHRD